MRIQRLAAAAAATALTATLVGCGEAQDVADTAKSAASEAASSAASQATEKASEAASKATDKVKKKAKKKAAALFEDATAKLSPEDQRRLRSLALVGLGTKGALADDADAVTAAKYFAARQAMAADTGVDRTALEAVAEGSALRDATVYVTEHTGETGAYSVNILTSAGGTVNACVGPKAKEPRTLTVTDGMVVTDSPGDHDC